MENETRANQNDDASSNEEEIDEKESTTESPKLKTAPPQQNSKGDIPGLNLSKSQEKKKKQLKKQKGDKLG